MKRARFIGLAGAALAAAAGAVYWSSDKRNLLRADLSDPEDASRPREDFDTSGNLVPLPPDAREILHLASLAPSGHNTQPWFVQPLAPYRWIVGQDRERCLPAVDPRQRETLLSIGAFMQNLDYAAAAAGYTCRWTLLAAKPQDERVMEVALVRSPSPAPFAVESLKNRRTVRSGFLRETLRPADVARLIGGERDFIHYRPTQGPECIWLDEQTVEANRLQAWREPAQRELARWIRFSSAEARRRRDGLTTAGLELNGLAGWWVRNTYGEDDVLTPAFRERGLDGVRREVASSAGWILITSRDETVESLLEAGRRMQRLFLQVRALGIAMHPMTQILEEETTRRALPAALGFEAPVQFILRVGYITDYPPPVSLRRPVEWFLRPDEGSAATPPPLSTPLRA